MPRPSDTSAAGPRLGRVDLTKLPLSFEPNAEQTDPGVHFLARASGATFYFGESEIRIALQAKAVPAEQEAKTDAAARIRQLTSAPPFPATGHVIRLRFLGATAKCAPTGGRALPGKVNYLIGNDPARWQKNLPTYSEVAYRGLFPETDLVYEGDGRRLKGTYHLAAGADPSRIRWSYEGASRVSIAPAGNLQIELEGAEAAMLTEEAPVAWQEMGDQRVPVRVSYRISGEGEAGFEVGEFDRTRPLVIDPALTYSTYLGGNGLDTGYGLAVDDEGSTYLTGVTGSDNFPVAMAFQPAKPPNFNAYVAKLNATGTALIYSTYLGGNSTDISESLAIDSGGNVYVTGYTQSTDFPTVSPYQATIGGSADAFVAKLSADGSTLLYGTYLGGEQFDRALDVVVDSERNIYLVGFTGSANFPTANAYDATKGANGDDAFLTKLNPAGSALVYSTFLGGSSTEVGEGLAVDDLGSAYVCGITASNDFPTMNPAQPVLIGTVGVLPTGDAFMTKFNPQGSALVYSTYLGGIEGENAQSIAVDPAHNAVITGLTRSPNYPVTPGAFQPISGGGAFDAFVTKLNATGMLAYSSFLGGGGFDAASNLTVDAAGHAYIAGETASSDFPTTADAIQSAYAGGTVEGKDAFVTQINADGTALVFSTFLGGSGDDYGGDIVAVPPACIYLTGYTNSNNFPTAGTPFQPALAGGVDAFVLKIDKQATPTPTPTPSPTPTPGATPSRESCEFPGRTVITDPSGDQDGGPAANQHLDIQSVSFAEPYIPEFDEPDFLTATIKVASLPTRPPNTTWRVKFTAPAGTQHFVQMRTGNGTAAAYEYGHIDEANPDGEVDGIAQTGSNAGDGTIRMFVLNSQLGGPMIGQTLTGIGAFTRTEIGAGTLVLGDSAGGNATYTLVSNFFCRTQTAPIPALSATPTSGSAPLEVAFDASGSFDQDGDTITSYTFDFDDGAAPVTQAEPAITHTFAEVGTYNATVRASDGRGLTSPNGAQVAINVLENTVRSVSRKTHGSTGAFEINLPLTGAPGIECRQGGGASSDLHQVVFRFAQPVTFTGASATPAPGRSAEVESTATNANEVIVNLKNVSNAQTLSVTLLAVNDGAATRDISVPMGVLRGDTSADGAVNSADVTQARRQSGQAAAHSNFRADLSVDGVINSADVTLARRASGSALP